MDAHATSEEKQTRRGHNILRPYEDEDIRAPEKGMENGAEKSIIGVYLLEWQLVGGRSAFVLVMNRL